MKKFYSGLFFLSFFILSSTLTQAQTWVEMRLDPDANFYETVEEFENYWENRTIEKGKGYKQFRRWQDYMEPRVFPKGDVKQAGRAKDEFKKYKEAHAELFAADRAANWTLLGPVGAPGGGGAGRINFLRFHPGNTNILYAGAPAGGLWISTNGGSSWTTNTDQLSVIGCTDIAIDPTNTQVMYLATGDGDAGDTYSIGVLKSTDGGATWNTTGLTWTVTQGRTISKLLINPTNTQIVLAATSNGVYRTTNGGTSWTQEQTGNFKDMEFKPGDPNTVYVCGTTFWRSTNAGDTFTQVTSGVPTGTARLAIAVTPANVDYVYLLSANNTNSGFQGIYRSTNSGTGFTTRATSPNLLGWSSTGSDTGGQGWYDLAIAASETNADVVIVGGVNIWRSTNGGTNWTINAHWTGSGAPYVHADIHDLIFVPGSGTSYYSANDGGVARTTNSGGAWSDISANMAIAQQYEIGLSTSNASLLLAGHQDNGTNRMSGTTWTEVYGGDGMQCFIDRTNNNIMVASYVYGDFLRSTNGGGSWSGITSGLSGNAAWEAPIHQDPVTSTTYYCGYSQMFRTTNSGTSWSQIGTISGSGTIVEFDVAPSNNQVIYTLRSNAVFKSTNAGGSWTNITGTLPVSSAALTYVDVNPTNPDHVYVTFSGYSSGNKVFMSTNGGTSWTNYSTGLPNLPANCIVYQNGSSDGVYLGTDVGVYYRDNTLTSWQPYMTNLPNVVVEDLEIYYGTGKIRAGTFGRGTWESDLYSPGANPPVADFTADNVNVCIGSTVNFTDLSAFSPTSWSWDFGGGGTPNTSTSQNPSIVFNTAGTYTVTLTATNANGSDSEVKTAYITVTGTTALPLVEGFESTTFPPSGWFVLDANANGNTWVRNGTEGGFGTSTASAFFDNFNVDEAGGRDELQTPKYDFNAYSSATMTFDVAYARYNATYYDSLIVLVTTDCGQTFTTVYAQGNTGLATAPDVTTAFAPTNTQWRTETVNMTPYVGNPNVMVIFQNRGRYGNNLYIDNVNITGVSSGPIPVADFSGTPTTVCVGQSVNFTDLSTNTPTSWSWSVTGPATFSSTLQNPSFTFTTAGVYTVSLTATNSNGSDTETKTNYITVNALPAASAGSNSPICAGQTLNLTTTTVTGATYSWSGPSGYTSTAQNPSRTNATTAMSGTYTVTVTANGCTNTSSVNVTVNANPTASASSNSPICSGQTLNLTTTTVTGATYSWSGPSGYTSTAQNPTRTNATTAMSGTYTVTVTANGCSSTSSTSVTVNQTPAASAGSNSPVCTGQTLNLTTTTVTGATYSWSGPSGYTSTAQNPSRTNATTTMAGTYTVTVTANGCSATSSTSVTVNTTPSTTASSNSPVCSGSTINLAATTVTGATYSWSGPNSYTSTSQNPSITNATTAMSGTYTVTVTANGCSSTSSTSVTVNQTPAASAGSNSPVCTGQTLNLTTTTVTGATYSWSGPSGYTSTAQNPSRTNATTGMSGTYTVTVTANGCTNTSSVSVTVNNAPTASASSNSPVCSGFAINLTTTTVSGATYSWTGPNSFTSTAQNPSITNSTTAMSGTYTVTVNNGCTATSSTTVTVNQTPAASATSNSPVCVGNTITLNTTNVSGATYSWSGPGGYTASVRNPSRTNATTAMSGTYTVTVTANGCSNTSSVNVTVNPLPNASAGSNSPLCSGQTLNLTTPTVTGATYSWSGPSGYTSTAQNPSRTNATTAMSGTYTVTVTANGCSSTSSTSVTVNQTPTASAGSNSPVCTGQTLNLTTTTVTGATYSWSGPSGYTSTSQNPSRTNVTTAMSGTYTVTVTANGCSATSSTSVTVNQTPATPIITSNSPLCTGQTLTLFTTAVTGGTYAWSNQGTWTSTVQNPTRPNATLGMGQTYYLIVTANGCSSAQASHVVVVNQTPATPTASSNSPVCSGNTINLTTPTVTGATYSWTGPSSFTSTSQNPTRPNATTAMSGSHSVTVTVNGCTSASGSTNVTVNATPATPTASSNSPVCTGSSINLTTPTVSGATYSWTGPNAFTSVSQNPTISSASASNAGTYNVTITVGGCTSAAGSTAVSVGAAVTPSVNIAVTSGSNPTCAGENVAFTATPTNGGSTPSYQWQINGGNVGTNSDNYANASLNNGDVITCIMTSSAGCVTSSTATSNGITMTVNDIPTVTANANSNPICIGETLILTGGGASNYVWDNSVTDGVGFTATADQTYNVTGTDANGCVNTAQISVVVNDLPNVSYVETLDTLCSSESGILLSAGTPSGGTYSGTGVSGNTFDPSVAGVGLHTVTYTFTDGNGCSNSVSSDIYVDNCTGITYAENDFETIILPNPTTGEFHLILPQNVGDDALLTIYDNIGKVVYKGIITDFTQKTTIDFSAYSRGMYHVVIVSGEKRSVQKLIRN